MVAGGAANHAFPALGGVEMRHLVVGASQLEAEDRLFILALEEDLALESVAEVDGVGEVGDLAGLVNSGCCAGNESEVLYAEIELANHYLFAIGAK